MDPKWTPFEPCAQGGLVVERGVYDGHTRRRWALGS